MGGLRNIVFGLGLTLLAPAPPLCAQPSDPMHLFATCTGRLSALMEYQWLVQDKGADATEMARDAMAQLLDAAMPPDDRVHTMDLRLQAKAAEAQLLQQALTRNGQWALALAKRHMADCTALLVS